MLKLQLPCQQKLGPAVIVELGVVMLEAAGLETALSGVASPEEVQIEAANPEAAVSEAAKPEVVDSGAATLAAAGTVAVATAAVMVVAATESSAKAVAVPVDHTVGAEDVAAAVVEAIVEAAAQK